MTLAPALQVRGLPPSPLPLPLPTAKEKEASILSGRRAFGAATEPLSEAPQPGCHKDLALTEGPTWWPDVRPRVPAEGASVSSPPPKEGSLPYEPEDGTHLGFSGQPRSHEMGPEAQMSPQTTRCGIHRQRAQQTGTWLGDGPLLGIMARPPGLRPGAKGTARLLKRALDTWPPTNPPSAHTSPCPLSLGPLQQLPHGPPASTLTPMQSHHTATRMTFQRLLPSYSLRCLPSALGIKSSLLTLAYRALHAAHYSGHISPYPLSLLYSD